MRALIPGAPPLPASLRLALVLLVLATLAATASIPVIKWQDAQRARIAAEQMTGGRTKAGEAAIGRYGCGACHDIPGIAGADGQVGPPLKGVASRTEIAGRLPNEPEQMIAWLRDPQAIVPGNGMPDQGISERDARDIAAYLYTLRTSS